MISESDVILVPLGSHNLIPEIFENAEKACIGGKSYIRASAKRKESLLEDQLVGQIGNLVGAQWLLGIEEGLAAYREIRAIANENPTQGDGGIDLPGFRIDFKASLYRYPHLDPLDYNLLVRPAERHPDTAYVQLLIDQGFTAALIMGWLDDNELPPMRRGGPFDGAHVRRIREISSSATLGIDGYAIT